MINLIGKPGVLKKLITRSRKEGKMEQNEISLFEFVDECEVVESSGFVDLVFLGDNGNEHFGLSFKTLGNGIPEKQKQQLEPHVR